MILVVDSTDIFYFPPLFNLRLCGILFYGESGPSEDLGNLFPGSHDPRLDRYGVPPGYRGEPVTCRLGGRSMGKKRGIHPRSYPFPWWYLAGGFGMFRLHPYFLPCLPGNWRSHDLCDQCGSFNRGVSSQSPGRSVGDQYSDRLPGSFSGACPGGRPCPGLGVEEHIFPLPYTGFLSLGVLLYNPIATEKPSPSRELNHQTNPSRNRNLSKGGRKIDKVVRMDGMGMGLYIGATLATMRLLGQMLSMGIALMVFLHMYPHFLRGLKILFGVSLF